VRRLRKPAKHLRECKEEPVQFLFVLWVAQRSIEDESIHGQSVGRWTPLPMEISRGEELLKRNLIEIQT
jgi:hypothetical protein